MRILLILFATCLSISSYSQEIVVQSIGPAASGFSQSGPSLAYTMGELVIEPKYGDTVSVGSGMVYLVDTVAITSLMDSRRPDLGVLIFPNPAVDRLNIEFTDLHFEPTIQIHSISGNLLHSLDVRNSDQIALDFSKYSGGIYLLNLIHPLHGTVSTYKIQKN